MRNRNRFAARILGVAGLALLLALAASCSDDADDAIERGEFTILVTFAGEGSGSVGHDLGAAVCETSDTDPCLWGFTEGLQVTLTATADAGSVFAGWSGACTGTDPECTLVVDRQWDVTATFDLED